MAWFILVLAGATEVSWAVGLKYSAGFTRLGPSIFTNASMVVSLGLLGIALKSIPLGTAYAVWTGIGTVGAMIAGMMLFGETVSLVRIACVGLIVAGIAGLKLSAV